jgi:23S rRNA maturation-related 3'-5' exoribonuclease YhaM
MHNPYGEKISDEIRQNVRDDLPMLAEIKSEEMREWVVEAWATSLFLNGFSAIRELQGSGMRDILVEKNATQADHLCGVASLSKAIGEAFLKKDPKLEIDIDTLVAGGLLHDLGKPLMYNVENMTAWMKDPYKEGNPSATHAMYGYYICMLLGLPTYICHIPANHCVEAEAGGVIRSIACTIVNHADYVYWDALKVLGWIDTSYSFRDLRLQPYQYDNKDYTQNYYKEIMGDLAKSHNK